MNDFRSIGRAYDLDGSQKLRGAAKYAGDLSVPGMLHGVTLFAPVPRALVKAIDAGRARKMPGVVVLTADNVSGSNRFGPVKRDQPVLVGPGEEARFVGDALALVAAESPALAREARDRIEVELEELPVVSSIEEALQGGAPAVHAEVPDNVCARGEVTMGDVEAGFAQAAVIVEETVRTPRQEHAYLEPEAALATFDERGRVILYSCVQDPYYFGYDIAQAVGLPANRLRVVATPLGGGFGGKDDITLQAHTVLLALHSGRPVRMVYSREESIRAHPKRHPMEIRLKVGATENGFLTALEAQVLTDAGAYTGRSPVVVTVALHSLSGPYAIPNLKLQGVSLFTNNLVTGACRGYGQPQTTAAREIVLDLLGARLGIDPVRLRKANAVGPNARPGTPLAKLDSEPSAREVIDAALAEAGELRPPAPGRRAGRGVACAMPLFDIGALPSLGLAGVSVGVEVMVDGSIIVTSSAVDMGQGVRSALALMAAEELGVDPGQVTVLLGDTDTCPKSGPTTGSRQTYVSGNALLAAARALKERMATEAAERLDASPDQLEFREGAVRVLSEPHRALTLGDLARHCYYHGINLREESWFKAGQAIIGHTFVATVADVEVDTTTGDVQVRRLVTAHDIGRAINPTAVRGQLIGGSVQSLGWALTEDLAQEACRIMTPSLSEYIVPTAMDVPEVEAVLIENPYPSGPFGAKGVGEHATVTTAPALLNAIYSATGVMVRDYPATPEKLARALGAFDESDDPERNTRTKGDGQ
ncbi:MAG: xanthine dehydrogenase family protein molybdopterin-binding subunit [Thermoleophilia bacterium]|nr:xanthine dehydrogenase family protein molybdopterin-binding subunit [Thermoleophilia bacterium]